MSSDVDKKIELIIGMVITLNQDILPIGPLIWTDLGN